VFRLPQAGALINRLGFNNEGLDALVSRVRSVQLGALLGINLGKNADTPIERAGDDYAQGLATVYPYARYVTINVSSPNTARGCERCRAQPNWTRCWRAWRASARALQTGTGGACRSR